MLCITSNRGAIGRLAIWLDQPLVFDEKVAFFRPCVAPKKLIAEFE
jgi:hypothetical protein